MGEKKVNKSEKFKRQADVCSIQELEYIDRENVSYTHTKGLVIDENTEIAAIMWVGS